MATSLNHGHQAEWAIVASSGDPSTASFTGATAMEPVSDSIGINEDIAQSEALMGTRFGNVDRSRKVSEVPSGQLVFEASPSLLGVLLPYITGDASTPHVLQEAAASDFDWARNEGGTDWAFRNCFVQRATLSPRNGKIGLTLDVVGKTAEHDFGSFANAASQYDTHDEPYADFEAAINIASGTRYADQWSLTIDNGLELLRRQSLTPNRLRLGMAQVTFSANIEWDSSNEAAVYAQGKEGLAATLTLSRSLMSTVFTLGKLVIPESPVGVSNSEIMYNFNGVVRQDLGAGTDIISIAHDDNNAT